MFHFFRQSFKLKTMTLIMTMLILHYIVIVGAYSSILKNDFNAKMYDFNEQYKTNVSTRMNAVENSAKIFLQKYCNNSVFEKYDWEMNKTLARMKMYSTDVCGAFMCGSKDINYYTDSAYLSIVDSAFSKAKGEESVWLYCCSEADYREFLLYGVRPGGIEDAMLFLEISPQILVSANKSNVFYDCKTSLVRFEKSDSCMLFENNSFKFVKGRPKEKIYVDKAVKVYCKLEGKGIAVENYISTAETESRLFKYRVVSGGILLIFGLIAYIACAALARYIERNFEKICHKMQRFAKNPQEYSDGSDNL